MVVSYYVVVGLGCLALEIFAAIPSDTFCCLLLLTTSDEKILYSALDLIHGRAINGIRAAEEAEGRSRCCDALQIKPPSCVLPLSWAWTGAAVNYS